MRYVKQRDFGIPIIPDEDVNIAFFCCFATRIGAKQPCLFNRNCPEEITHNLCYLFGIHIVLSVIFQRK